MQRFGQLGSAALVAAIRWRGAPGHSVPAGVWTFFVSRGATAEGSRGFQPPGWRGQWASVAERRLKREMRSRMGQASLRDAPWSPTNSGG